MITIKNTFRKHDPKVARRNPDLLNVRHTNGSRLEYRSTPVQCMGNAPAQRIGNRYGTAHGTRIYELTDVIDQPSLLEQICPEERLIGICIGLGIAIVPVFVIFFLLG